MADTEGGNGAAEIFPLKGKRVWVAGHRGMVGSALVRRLAREDCEILTVSRDEVDLRRQRETEAWIAERKPDAVFLAAAKVGGILANDSRPAEFLYENLLIETNVIHAAHIADVAKLLFLGSACIYPKMAPQPIPEEALMTGPLEPTNRAYAVAKIAGILMCQSYRRQYGRDFIAAQPNNLYGPHDNFDLVSSHVISALMVKTHNAKTAGAETMEIWGSGKPMREFLHVDDLADVCVFLMRHYSDSMPINVGTGDELTIRDLATTIAGVVGFKGRFTFDATKPDGTPRKLVDAARLNGLGWKASIPLVTGLESTYRWYLENVA